MWAAWVYRVPEGRVFFISDFAFSDWGGGDMSDDVSSLRTAFQYNLGCPERKGQGQRVAAVFPWASESYRFAIVDSTFLQSFISLPPPKSPTKQFQLFKTIMKMHQAICICAFSFIVLLCISLFLYLPHFLSSPCGLH